MKEKGLKAGDVICFQQSTEPDKQLYIECRPRCKGPGTAISPAWPVQMVRIFGVNIIQTQGNGGGGVDSSSSSSYASLSGGCSNGKRIREVELLSMECSKKQMVIGAL